MFVAVLSGTARMGLSPRGLRRVSKPTPCGPSPPASRRDGAPLQHEGSRAYAELEPTPKAAHMPYDSTSATEDKFKGAGVGGGSDAGVGIGRQRQRPSWRQGCPGC